MPAGNADPVAEQYLCEPADQRLEAVRSHNLDTPGQALNGIDVVEVDGGHPGVPAQRTIVVRCLEPVPDSLRGGQVEVTGGVRVDPRLNPVRVRWALPASALAGAAGAGPDQPSAADVDAFAGLPDPQRTLIVRTSSAGDFSTYRFRILEPESHGFDRQLAEVPFSFKVDCPTGFDCRIPDPGHTAAHPAPPIDYLARDYHGLRRLLLDRLSLLLPDWTERNPADIGVTLVELFAYLGDQLAYAQDAVATEAYLGTARHRVSVRRHARLLDYRMHDGAAARTWLVVEVEPAADGTELPAGTEVRAGEVTFRTLHPVTARRPRSRIPLHTWSSTGCVLPAGATGVTLRRSATTLRLAAGDVLVLAGAADRDHRWAVRLAADPEPGRDQLTGTLVTSVRWHPDDALPFPLALDDAVAYGNVVLVQHGEPVGPEELIPAEVPAQGRFRPRLKRLGLAHAVPYADDRARTRPATEALAVRAAEAVADLELLEDGAGAGWEPRLDLLASDRFDPHYVVETEDDGRAYLRFGDNLHGRHPAGGTVLSVRYRVGGGRAGNVGPDTLTTLAVPVAGVAVHNPLPAQGGADPEPVEQVRQWAPQAFRVQQRAVTEADYAAAAERHPRVQRAAATRRWTGSWYTHFVTVDRRGGGAVDPGFATEIAGFLDPFRLAGHDLDVDSPVFVPLDIVLAVCVAEATFRGEVRLALRQAFDGFFAPDRVTFAQPVYASRVVATGMAVPGVVSAELVRFQRWGRPDAGELAGGRIALGRLEVARCDSDPNQPENGRIDFQLGGGL